MNAANVVSRSRAYGYAEGFAASADMYPILHGWCVNFWSGKAFDPTLKEPETHITSASSFDVGRSLTYYGSSDITEC